MTLARPDTEVVFDPATYVDGVPFKALARLRSQTPVVWVAEIPVLGWPAGPGFWLVLRHADVGSVLARPQLFSSSLGATQIRDPATPQALGYVRPPVLPPIELPARRQTAAHQLDRISPECPAPPSRRGVPG
jgi:cytochrome P450